MNQRILQINELIQRNLGEIFAREIELPAGCLITITQVETMEDLREANVWLSIFPIDQSEIVLKLILRRIGELQKLLNRKIAIRYVPRIKFILDHSAERADQVEKVLHDFSEQEKS